MEAALATIRSTSGVTTASIVASELSLAIFTKSTFSTLSAAAITNEKTGNVSTIAAFESPLRTSFLAVFTAISFIGNLLLLLAIGQSRALRKTAINVHLMGMAIANLLFSGIDMPLMIAYSVTEQWDYGTTACSVFAFLHMVSSVQYTLGVFCLGIDRLMVVKSPRTQGADTNALAKAIALVVSCWFVSLSSGVPLLSGSVPVVPYSDHFTCDIGNGDTTVTYSAVIYACLFTVPPVLTVLLLMITASVAMREQTPPVQHSYNSNRQRPALEASPSVLQGAKGAVFVLILLVLWILFVAPHVALASVELYSHTTAGAGMSPALSRPLNLIFMWLLCAHNMVLPFASFTWRQDIWLNFKDVMTWRKTNTVVDVGSSSNDRLRSHSADRQPAPDRFPARFKVPVLIATESGLHVHDDSADDGGTNRSGDQHIFYADFTTRSNEITVEKPIHDAASSNSDIANESVNLDCLRFASVQPRNPGGHLQPTSVQTLVYGSANPASDTAAGQANSLSTDSGVGSAAGSASRRSKKTRSRGALLVRTRSQPVPAFDDMPEPSRGRGAALPRSLLPQLTLADNRPWPSQVPVNDYSAGVTDFGSRYRDAATRAVDTRELTQERDHDRRLTGTAMNFRAHAAVAENATTGQRKVRRKKRHSKHPAVESVPALQNYGGDISLPLRPPRLRPIANAPALAVDTAYSHSHQGQMKGGGGEELPETSF